MRVVGKSRRRLDGRDVDDRPAGRHYAQHSTRDTRGREKVRVPHRLPVAIAKFIEGLQRLHRTAMNQPIHTPPAVDDIVDQARPDVGIGCRPEVSLKDCGCALGLLDRIDDGLGRVFVRPVVDGHREPTAGAHSSDSATKVPRRTRHHDYPTLAHTHHLIRRLIADSASGHPVKSVAASANSNPLNGGARTHVTSVHSPRGTVPCQVCAGMR